MFRPIYLSVALAVATWFSVQGHSLAQDREVSLNPKYIPAEANLLLSIRPSSIQKLPEMELVPFEIVEAFIEDLIGLKAGNMERVDLVVDTLAQGYGYVITLERPVAESDLNLKLFVGQAWEETEGFKYLRCKSDPSLIVHCIDSRHYIAGDFDYCQEIISGTNEPGPLSQLVAKVKSPQNAIFLFSMEACREKSMEMMGQIQAGMPGNLTGPINTIMTQMNSLAIRWVNNPTHKLQLVVTAEEDGDIAEVQQAVVSIVAFIDAQYQQLLPMLAGMGNESLAEALQTYIERTHEELEKTLAPRMSKNNMLVEIPLDDPLTLTVVGAIGTTMTGMPIMMMGGPNPQGQFLPANDVTDPNIQQIVLAMHNFESAYKGFPPAAIVDADDKPLLSWRVAILPFLNEQELYQEFHLDEPWDSEHNLKLVEKMPAIYKHTVSGAEKGKTIYQAVVGDAFAISPTEKSALRGFADGTSNTAVIVQVDDEHATPWTAPNDFEPDSDQASKGLRLHEGVSEEGYIMGFADGSVRLVPLDLQDVLMFLFTRNGGEVIQF